MTFPRDPHDLLGDFWPKEESIDEFLAAMREWRGHAKRDPADVLCPKVRAMNRDGRCLGCRDRAFV